MAKPQYSGPWRRVRLAVLNRDGWQCQIRGPKCTGRATEVDHMDPVSQYGANVNPARLRAACKPCNAGLGAALTNAKRERRASRVW